MKSKREKTNIVSLPNIKDEPITGILRQNNLAKPLLVICHGYGITMDHPSVIKLSESLYQHGHNTFRFNFSKSAQLAAIEQQVADIETITHYFSSYTDIILLGGSLGALSAAIAAQRLKKVTGLITVNGFFGKNYLHGKILKTYILFKLTALFVKKNSQILSYMKKELQPGRIRVPTLVIHSQTDKGVSIKQSQYFYSKLNSSKKFYALKNTDHELLTEGSIAEVVKTIDVWLKEPANNYLV